MAQTRIGALKVAAIKAGMTFEAYAARVEAGGRRCTKCKTWKIVSDFGRDRTRSDGLGRCCITCRRVKERISTKGRISTFKGKRHADATKGIIGAKRRGNKYRLGKTHTAEARAKISSALRVSAARGADAPGYIDGKGAERLGQRASAEVKRWRYDVFVRDEFMCCLCGDAQGGNLNAHHIYPFAEHHELRTDVGNGVTLCKGCHSMAHIYGLNFWSLRRHG